MTATTKVKVKKRAKNLVVGRASITTGDAAHGSITFALTSQGAKTLRKLGRMRLSVTVVTTAANGATAHLSRTVSVKKPAKKR